jgi:hypothetical protein
MKVANLRSEPGFTIYPLSGSDVDVGDSTKLYRVGGLWRISPRARFKAA